MNYSTLLKTVKVFLIVSLSGLSVPAALHASSDDYDDDDSVREFEVIGVPVTGPNDACGAPLWSVPAPFPPNLHFTTLGLYNPDPEAVDALPLTPEACENGDALLATHSDPLLNASAGFIDADPRVKNIPLRQVKVTAFPDGTRLSLPSMKDSNGNPFPATKSEPNTPITVKDWFSAKGKMEIKCYDDGTSFVKAKFKNLIPNGVYSLMGTWVTIPPGQLQPTFAAIAFGGVPSTVAANKYGKAKFQRKMNYCPMDVSPDGSILMFVDLGYHMDGVSNGVLPSSYAQVDQFMDNNGNVFLSTKPPGIVTTPAVGFPINVGKL